MSRLTKKMIGFVKKEKHQKIRGDKNFEIKKNNRWEGISMYIIVVDFAILFFDLNFRGCKIRLVR